MKKKGYFITAAILLMLVIVVTPVNAALSFPASSLQRLANGVLPEKAVLTAGLAQGGLNKSQVEETEAPTEEPTEEPTQAPNSTQRPMLVINDYFTDPAEVVAGTNFNLHVELRNSGKVDAINVVMTFSAANFSPLETGGVKTKNTIAHNNTSSVNQSFYAAPGLWGYVVEPMTLSITYQDTAGGSYSESFSISISLKPASYVQPTVTPTVNVSRPRLLVTSSTSDIEVLQPGSQFELFLDITNLGSETARTVNMVVGGATVDVPQGTDTPSGGYSATGGDFTHFSPLGGSNVQALGDIEVGATFKASQPLIVNVTTTPGAYTLKISFVYMNGKGETLVDDQVITLLVKSVPRINISFYRETGDLFAFQPNALPIQIVNVGKGSVILGNMKVTASNGMVENGTMQVGYLDAGGYLTQDAMLTPDSAGEVTIHVTVDYVDDFNQPQTITQEMTVNVIEMVMPEIIEEPGVGMPVEEPINETFFQKVWRFIRGLLGLDSSPEQNQMEMRPEIPMEEGATIEGGGSVEAVPVKGP